MVWGPRREGGSAEWFLILDRLTCIPRRVQAVRPSAEWFHTLDVAPWTYLRGLGRHRVRYDPVWWLSWRQKGDSGQVVLGGEAIEQFVLPHTWLSHERLLLNDGDAGAFRHNKQVAFIPDP